MYVRVILALVLSTKIMSADTKNFTNEEKEKVIVVGVSLILFISCLFFSQLILPENCYLYDGRIIGFLCDGIDFKNPQPCPICRDDSATSAAQIVFGLGIGFLFLPFLVFAIKRLRNRPFNQTKLFN